jgi:hypothetical protein
MSRITQALCGVGHRRTVCFERCSDQPQEVSMTLTILDPRTGQQVTISIPDPPADRR